MDIMKKELHEAKNCYVELEQRLEYQEKVMKEFYEVKLKETEDQLINHHNERCDELQHTILTALSLSNVSTTLIIQQSQPKKPANGGAM